MSVRGGTVAQISTYPLDVRHFEYLLPHQMRAWGDSVERVLVTIDTYQSRAGRYRGTNFNESLNRLRQIVKDTARNFPKLEVVDVDYAQSTQREVAQYFFGRDSTPIKAWDGGPFYSYFYGLYAANAQYVMHFDGDMMFGGGSKTWIKDTIACMQQHAEVFVTAPFPGPPRADGKILGHENGEGFDYQRVDLPELAYRHSFVSTRAFFIDLNKFKARLGTIPWVSTSTKQKLKAKLLAHPPEAIEAEALLSKALQSSGSYRIDMLGGDPGMWSLHPPFRSEEFYRRLPEFIRAVEAGEVPSGQRGHYDLNDSMIDWTPARIANNWRNRYLRMIRDRLSTG